MHVLHNKIITTFTQIILLHVATGELKCAENAGKPKNLKDLEDFYQFVFVLKKINN